MIVNHASRERRNGVRLGGGRRFRYDPFTEVLNEESEKQSALKRNERLVI